MITSRGEDSSPASSSSFGRRIFVNMLGTSRALPWSFEWMCFFVDASRSLLCSTLSFSVLMLAGFADELGNPILEDLIVASWWIQTYLVVARINAIP